MRLPLLYSIAWPARVPMPWEPLSLSKIGTLTFKEADHEKYPCIPLAYVRIFLSFYSCIIFFFSRYVEITYFYGTVPMWDRRLRVEWEVLPQHA